MYLFLVLLGSLDRSYGSVLGINEADSTRVNMYRCSYIFVSICYIHWSSLFNAREQKSELCWARRSCGFPHVSYNYAKSPLSSLSSRLHSPIHQPRAKSWPHQRCLPSWANTFGKQHHLLLNLTSLPQACKLGKQLGA